MRKKKKNENGINLNTETRILKRGKAKQTGEREFEIMRTRERKNSTWNKIIEKQRKYNIEKQNEPENISCKQINETGLFCLQVRYES